MSNRTLQNLTIEFSIFRNISLYECVCDVGFLGDGYVCSLEPNCHNDPNLCPANSKCYQVGQQFQCVCDLGKFYAFTVISLFF